MKYKNVRRLISAGVRLGAQAIITIMDAYLY